jgi:hypothetical protein
MTTEQKREYLKANGWEMSWSDDNWVKSTAINKEANTGMDTEYAFKITIKKESVIQKTNLQKINRYYISNQGTKIIKCHNDGREIQVEAGRWRQTVCNDIKPFLNVPFESLDINKQYYLEKIYKEIENVTTQISKSGYIQGTLF